MNNQLSLFDDYRYIDRDLAGEYYPQSRKDHLSGRVVVWFSCGVTSAVAVKLAQKKYGEIIIAYTDPGGEHEDNKRFLADCELWFGQKVEILKSKRYKDTWDVWEKTRWLVGPSGARCTGELKKQLRTDFEDFGDIQVFGFDLGEQGRVDKFRKNNPEVYLDAILFDQGLSKQDCLAIVAKAGIEVPITYKMGYDHANCIPCVKGQSGYWNKIRVDFPDEFKRMSLLERDIDAAINKRYVKYSRAKDADLDRFYEYASEKTVKKLEKDISEGKDPDLRLRVYLDELDPKAGNYAFEPKFDCGLLCSSVSNELL